jgi:hypothetical protein
MALSGEQGLKSHYEAIIPVYNAAPVIDRQAIQAPRFWGNWQDASLRR